jgi:Fe2+ transport system protein FeoA
MLTDNSQIISLTFAPQGIPLKVISANGGQHFQRKIAALGIYPDQELEVIERHCEGAVIVRAKGTRLAIGHGMSRKIKVKIL